MLQPKEPWIRPDMQAPAPIHRSPWWLAAPVLLLPWLLLAACSSDDGSGTGGATVTTPAGTGTAGSGGSTSSGGGGFGGAGGEAGGAPAAEQPGLVDDYPRYDPPASAIHIDPGNANDPQEDGSLAHPFDSFGDVTWTDGLVVAVRRGTTLQTDVVEIRASDVTIASYGEDQEPRPVVHCTAVASAGNNRHALYATDRTNVVVRDLEIHAPDATSCVRFGGAASAGHQVVNCSLHGSGWGLRAFDVDGLTVLNTEVYDIDDDGMFLQRVTNIEIAHCFVHDVNQNWVPPYTPQSEAGGDAIQLSDCNRWHVHLNVLDRTNSGNKFCFISNNPAQDDGVFEHNRLSGPLTTGDGGASIYFHDGTGLVVRYNVVEGPSPGPLYTHATSVEVYGNVFSSMSGGLYASSSANVYHNVFHDLPSAMSGGDLVAHNNVFALSAPTDEPFGSTASLDESHNLFASGTATANSFVGDPAFVDATAGDFHLQATSDCIDSGIDVGLALDMDGVAVPQGSAPDVGAFEYVP